MGGPGTLAGMDTPEQDPGAQILDELRALRRREERLGKAKRALIREARLHDRKWADIADALGVDKEAVYGLYKEDIRRIQAAGADDELTNEDALEQLRREDEALRRAGSTERS